MSISRRKFLQTCAAGFTAVATNTKIFANSKAVSSLGAKLGQAKLGKSGLTVSRLAMGTGTNGWRHQSNQTRLGMKGFLGLAEYAHDAGITFFDVADTYGSHTYLREALSQAKAKGLVRAHGVSCHSFEALKAAAVSDWVDVLLARINHTGSQMDDTPHKVMPVLQQAHDRGAGVIGMKIFGAGALAKEHQRQQSLEYVWKSGNVDAMTIGFESTDQISDAINRVNRVLKG